MDILNFNFPRHHSFKEDFLISFIVMGLAISIAYGRIIHGYAPEKFLFILLPAGILSSLMAFALNYLSTNFVANRYGIRVNYTLYMSGIIVALITSIFGFIISLPGSTGLITSGNKDIDGKIAISDPLANMTAGLGISGYLFFTSGPLKLVLLILSSSNLLVAALSSLPIPPLVGFTILKWNFYIYLIFLSFSIAFLAVLGQGFI